MKSYYDWHFCFYFIILYKKNDVFALPFLRLAYILLLPKTNILLHFRNNKRSVGFHLRFYCTQKTNYPLKANVIILLSLS